jgi:hypothetical protein
LQRRRQREKADPEDGNRDSGHGRILNEKHRKMLIREFWVVSDDAGEKDHKPRRAQRFTKDCILLGISFL